MERRFRFLPVETCVFDPEAGVMKLAPIGHRVRVQELDCEVEATHPAVFLEVPDKLVLQGVRVASLQRTRWIVRKWRGRILDNIDRSVTERYVAPVTKLLIWFDFLVRLHLN